MDTPPWQQLTREQADKLEREQMAERQRLQSQRGQVREGAVPVRAKKRDPLEGFIDLRPEAHRIASVQDARKPTSTTQADGDGHAVVEGETQ